MKLYHGSPFRIERPEILKSERFLDFGCGFYTTTNKDQATRWALIKKNRTNAKNSFLNIYEIEDSLFFDKEINLREFVEVDRSWLEFVMANRQGEEMHNYDLVKGAVADDTLYQTFILYESGILSVEETIIRLKVHTKKAIKKLNFAEAFKLSI
ncbi:MAG: DUF3990 domain-containing protein [Dysgonamonadaceae bacterium]|jgi:hypothetical protein|nr:DUF3990 domain-containing protein [Dysgonamonadaceae bacterium]